MTHYIVCHKKRNNPRIHVRICEKKCSLRADCEEYLTYCRLVGENKSPSLPETSQTVELSAA